MKFTNLTVECYSDPDTLDTPDTPNPPGGSYTYVIHWEIGKEKYSMWHGNHHLHRSGSRLSCDARSKHWQPVMKAIEALPLSVFKKAVAVCRAREAAIEKRFDRARVADCRTQAAALGYKLVKRRKISSSAAATKKERQS